MSILSRSQQQVREHYAQVALSAGQGQCAERGCGDALSLACLQPGETVLDLGCGCGSEVLQAAGQVGSRGFVFGLDMTLEMLSLARRRAREQQVDNIKFLVGMIEDIPLADASVDVVISNCVINLCDDKPAALAEALRVLKPGGRMEMADIVAIKPQLSPPLLTRAAAIIGCSNGVLLADDYFNLLIKLGFYQPHIEPYRTFSFAYIKRKAVVRNRENHLAGLDAVVFDEALAAAHISGRKP
ncbi:MAG: methyltransferase domain-containing protein [Coriobacteriales bacterium]|jgi:ubiquinone/menaquinone biosynthesis C-methylase UbiE|nr:methyltransferase domain-containing protein [Coriobacteriales bacterium]